MRKKLVEDENKPILVREETKKAKSTKKKDEESLLEAKMLQKATKEKKKVSKDEEKKKPLKTAKKALKTDAEKPKQKAKSEDKLATVVVAAELEEQEPKKPVKAKKPKQNAKPARKVHEQKTIKQVGEKSQEILNVDSNKKTNEEEKYELFKKLLVAQKTRQILYGEVYGIEPNPKLGKVVIAVLWNGIKISIPDTEYFEDNFDFGERYAISSEEEKLKRRRDFASYQNGARVCFLVKGVVKDPVGSNESIICVGSRKEAMALMRDIYFYHLERKHPVTEKSEVKIGDIAEANVISVKNDYVIVECLGVETRIHADSLTDDYVENCNDFVKPGDTIKVKVVKVHINGTASVYLTVTGKVGEPAKQIQSMQVRSSYLGVVENVNYTKKIYDIRLKNSVLANVLFENVQGEIPLFKGDRVAVKVSKLLETRVYGSAMKL